MIGALALVGQFVIFGLPLYLRGAGAGSDVMSLISLSAIPYVARVFRAPLVDRFGLRRLRHRAGQSGGGGAGPKADAKPGAKAAA